MILDHVAKTAGGFVEPAPPLHAEILGHGYLNTGHAVAIPDGLEERIGKAEVEDIYDRLVPEKVVNAEDRIFREHRPGDTVELPRGSQVACERLFNNDAGMLGQVRGTKPLDYGLKERGRDGRVVRRTASATQLLFYRRERARVMIIPTYIPKL
jgi:hypothetical protein